MSIRLLSYQQSSEKAQKTSCCFVFQYEPLVCMILCKTIQEKKLSSCECVWLKVSNVLDEEELVYKFSKLYFLSILFKYTQRVYFNFISKVVKIYSIFFMVYFFQPYISNLISNRFCSCSVKGSHSKNYFSNYLAVLLSYLHYKTNVTANDLKRHIRLIPVTLCIFIFCIALQNIVYSYTNIYLHSNNSSRVYFGVFITHNIINTN